MLWPGGIRQRSLKSSMNKKVILITNDVEHTSIIHGRLTENAGNLVSSQGMPRLLDLYDKYQVNSVFFFTGAIAKSHPETVKAAHERGHEVACHGLSHESKHAFDLLPLQDQIRHLREAKAILEDLSGDKVVSFRAPALRVNGDTALALAKTGFEIDSSIASQRFDMFFSHGSSEKIKWLFSPRGIYKTEQENLFKKGKGAITEIIVYSISPAVISNEDTVLALAKTSFEIDSSIASQRFDMFFSHGSSEKIKWLFSPRGIYQTEPENLFKKGNGPIIEVPVSAMWFPYIGTTLRIFPRTTRLLRYLLNFEAKYFNRPINFLTHPNEFIEEELEEDNKVERRGSNIISYLLADYLRSKIKMKNLGLQGLKLLEEELRFFKRADSEFMSIKNFVKRNFKTQ